MAEKLIYTIEINTSDSAKSIKGLKEDVKQLNTALVQVEVGSDSFIELNNQLRATQNELQKVGVAAGSIGDVKLEIQQITKELATTRIDSPEYNTLIQKLGIAKAELKDFKNEVKALDPDEKFKAFIGLGTSIAGGFNIATGALSLFGQENENVTKAVQQSVAALQILQGLQSLADAADNINIVKRVIGWKTTAKAIEGATVAQNVNTAAVKSGVISFQALKVALASVGIGLLITAISEIVANWDKLKSTFGNFAIFKSLGDIVSDTKERFTGAFYGIVESIKPFGKLVLDFVLTPLKTIVDGVKIVGKVLSDPFNFENLKSSAKEFGNLFVDASKKIIDDINNVSEQFNKGFDKGVGIVKDREALAERKKLIEEEIKTLEQAVQFLKSGSEERLKVEQEIINKKLEVTSKGTEDYNKLLVDQFQKSEEIKDKQLEVQKKNAEAREKQFKEFENKIKSESEVKEQEIEINTAIKVNDGQNPIEAEKLKDIEISQNKLLELEKRKALYESYGKDVTSIINEIALTEQKLIGITKNLFTDLSNIEFNQDNANLQKYVDEQTLLIENAYKDQLQALVNKNLSTEELNNEIENAEKERSKKLTDLKKKEFSDKINIAKDYNQDYTQILKDQTQTEIDEYKNELEEKARLQKEYDESQLEAQKEIDAQLSELKAATQQFIFDQLNSAVEQQYQKELTDLENRKAQEIAIIDKQEKAGVLSRENATKKKSEIDKKYDKEKRKLERDAAKKKQEIAIIEAIINTAVAVTSALTTPPPAGYILAALSAALGAVEIATISSQPLPALKTGGLINDDLLNRKTNRKYKTGGVINAKSGKLLTGAGVKGTETSDENLALLSKGEAVINANSVKIPGVLPILSYLNELGGGVKFRYAEGGLNNITTNNSVSNFQNSIIDLSSTNQILKDIANQKIKAYVVGYEVTDQQQSDERIESRASF